MLPYPSVKTYQGQDIFMDLEFLDHTMTPVVPTAITLEIDDLTNSNILFNRASLSAGGSVTPPLQYAAFASAMTIQISGSLMQMTFPYQGSEIVQFAFSFTALDSVTGVAFTAPCVVIVELVAVQTVSGN